MVHPSRRESSLLATHLLVAGAPPHTEGAIAGPEQALDTLGVHDLADGGHGVLRRHLGAGIALWEMIWTSPAPVAFDTPGRSTAAFRERVDELRMGVAVEKP
ncbi:MAG: hypothetical protein LJE91_08815 [Gammaproteobacteria bacterium]|jgi:hypothetical protein|nr:hypothetical protein [Gammaproteobacteria bacterium]